MSANPLDFDNFLFAGTVDLGEEIASEILAYAVQPKRSMYYNRSVGSSLNAQSGAPVSLSQSVLLAYEITKTISVRNQRVTAGRNGTPDRRAAVSQKTISVVTGSQGEVDVQIGYIPLFDYSKQSSVTTSMG